MKGTRERIAETADAVRPALDDVRSGVLRIASDDDLIALLGEVAAVQRLVDGVMIAAVEEASRRSAGVDTEQSLNHRFGCATMSELLQRCTRVSAATAGRWQTVAEAVSQDVTLAGEPLELRLPALRAAVLAGEVGLDGALAIAAPLTALRSTVSREELLDADAALVATARGDEGLPPPADLLRVHAQAWAEALDRDGAEPRETRMARKRALVLGRPTEDGVPVRGMLLPDVAAQLQTIFDATLSPRQRVAFAPADEAVDAPLDDRTRPQRQHDALATALTVAASSGLLPTVGGAAPTLVVSVRAEDLVGERGSAHVSGGPVSLAIARHVACSGVVQRVTLGENGRILRLGAEERVFNRHQRRAIALRDGGCIIPGCGVPAGWCEIHHVTEHAAGGPTHTDNGVLICWFHHRFIDKHGWRIRMNRGVPEVQAPVRFDATLRWRAVTTSRTRLADQVLRR